MTTTHATSPAATGRETVVIEPAATREAYASRRRLRARDYEAIVPTFSEGAVSGDYFSYRQKEASSNSGYVGFALLYHEITRVKNKFKTKRFFLLCLTLSSSTCARCP